jgi:hypothetical protein
LGKFDEHGGHQEVDFYGVDGESSLDDAVHVELIEQSDLDLLPSLSAVIDML